MIKNFLTIFLTGIWISFSEFIRNELLFKYLWIEKYNNLGLIFPSGNINNIIWGIWSMLLGSILFYLSNKLKLVESIIISWLMAFVLMWLVTGNLNVLPFKLLIYAIPLSIIEVTVGLLICYKIKSK